MSGKRREEQNEGEATGIYVLVMMLGIVFYLIYHENKSF